MIDKRKPHWYEIEQKQRGNQIIPKETVWCTEYYVIQVSTRKGRVYNISHYDYVNSAIASLIKKGVTFEWIACPNKKFAYDAKEMLQSRYSIKETDREHQETTRKWKSNYGR